MPMLEEPFRRKRSSRSSAIFGSFFRPCCCVEIDAKSRSTIELIAISVILTELVKETQKDLVPFGGQTIQAPLWSRIVCWSMHSNGSQPLQSHAILSIETIDTVVDLKKKRRSCVRSPKTRWRYSAYHAASRASCRPQTNQQIVVDLQKLQL